MTTIRLIILCLLFPAIAFGGSATLSWTAPTQNTDGTPATDLAGFKFYYGNTSGGPYPNEVDLQDPAATTYVIDNLVAGDYFFVATAYNTAGVESDRTNEVTKTIAQAPPNPPAGLTVSDLVVFTIIKQADRFVLLPVGTVPAGTTCDPDESINGHFVVPRTQVQWSGTVQPLVVVAQCS